MKSKQLSDTGDSTKFMLTQESGLVCRNEKAHAVIRDVQSCRGGREKRSPFAAPKSRVP